MPSRTTLSVSQFDVFELEHPLQVVRLRHEEMRGEHFLDDGAHLRQCQRRLPSSPPFGLEKTVGDGREDDMALPARQAAAFEVIESELVLEFLVLLFDRPALMRQLDQGAQRRGGRQIHQVVADAVAARQFPFAEQPDFGRESSLRTPIVRGGDPDGTEAGAPGGIGAVAPRDESPPSRRLRGRPRARFDGVRLRRQQATGARTALARQRRGRLEAGVPRNTLRSDETPNA